MKAKTQLMLLTICVLALALINVFSVGTTMHFNEQRTEREQLVKQRLVQIRALPQLHRRPESRMPRGDIVDDIDTAQRVHVAGNRIL